MEEQGLTGDEVLPVPVGLFREYGEWFRRVKQVPVRPGLVTGYAPDLARVPYLAGLLEQIVTRKGFPVLDENFQTTVPGLYLTGFAAIQDFGPFLGFVKAAPATILLRHLQARWA